jgi:hypothetical protein
VSVFEAQKAVCERFGAEFAPPLAGTTVGISRDFSRSVYPLNGLRHPPHANTCGWYIWSGEQFSQADDFFVPVHVEHLKDDCPDLLNYLALPPGWRFLLAPGYEDAWFDPGLLISPSPCGRGQSE